MIAWEDWLVRLATTRRDEQLSPAATALRIIHSPFVDRFGLKRLEAWLEASDWLDWPGMFCSNGAEEYVKRCGIPQWETVIGKPVAIPGTWRGGNWVRSVNVAPETSIGQGEASELISDLVSRLTGILGPLPEIAERGPR